MTKGFQKAVGLSMRMIETPQDSDAANATDHRPCPEAPASLPNPEATAANRSKKLIKEKRPERIENKDTLA